MSQASNDAYVEELLMQAREFEHLTERVLQQRRRLFELATLYPGKVMEYFERQAVPMDPGERMLRTSLMKIALQAAYERLLRGG